MAPFTLKCFHSYSEQLLRIAFEFVVVLFTLNTNSLECKEAKAAENVKTLEVWHKTTESIFFSFQLVTFWYASKTT